MTGLLASLALLACGDSLTAGGGWPYALAGAPTVTNCGVYGATAWNAACEVDPLGLQDFCYARNAIDAHPEAEAIVLFYGTNDVRWAGWGEFSHDGTGRLAHALTRDALREMVADAEAAGLAIVLVIPPPVIQWPGTSMTAVQEKVWGEAIDLTLRAHVEDAAEGRAEIADLYRAFTLRDAAGLMECLYQGPNGTGDGVHMGSVACPDGKTAAQVIAAEIDRALARALAPR